jgi:hypothetical protein
LGDSFIGGVLLKATTHLICLAVETSTAPSPDGSPSASAGPSITEASPGPTKSVDALPADDAVFAGILADDSIEGGYAYLQAADGRRFEVIYPDGWRLQRSPLELIAPDGSVHSRAGDEVTVLGVEAGDIASICQIGPAIRATEVLDR